MKTDGDQKHVTFKLWHLFALVTSSACLLALYQHSQNVAILTSIAVFPTFATLVGSSRLRGCFVNGSIINRISLIALLCFTWLSFYILSIGPIVALIENLNIEKGSVETFYGPVIWLHDETLLEKPLEWYSDLWGWH